MSKKICFFFNFNIFFWGGGAAAQSCRPSCCVPSCWTATIGVFSYSKWEFGKDTGRKRPHEIKFHMKSLQEYVTTFSDVILFNPSVKNISSNKLFKKFLSLMYAITEHLTDLQYRISTCINTKIKLCKRICNSNYNKYTDCSNLKLLRSLSGRQQQGFTVSAGRQTDNINITNIYTFASVDRSSRWRTSKGKSHIRDGILWNTALNQYQTFKHPQSVQNQASYCTVFQIL